jgi:hypothetical protein
MVVTSKTDMYLGDTSSKLVLITGNLILGFRGFRQAIEANFRAIAWAKEASRRRTV